MIDYKAIIDGLEPLKVIELVKQLGADEIIEKSDHFITNTICHNTHDGSLKLYYYYNTHLFNCYTNCQSMSIFKFLETYYKERQIEYNWYKDIYQLIIGCSSFSPDNFDSITIDKIGDTYSRPGLIAKKLEVYPERVLDTFIKEYPMQWIAEGITKEAMDKFNILFSISQNKIIIPHYDIDNNLIGIRGRALNSWEIENIAKYAPVQIESKWYSHPLSLNLYGLNLTREAIRKTTICYIFESEKSVLMIEGFNMKNCSVAICGSNFNKNQMKLLLKCGRPQEIVLCLDKEEISGEEKYFYKLWNICNKYHIYCNFSFIYDKDNLLKLKDSPVDQGEETFRKLLKNRIRFKGE